MRPERISFTPRIKLHFSVDGGTGVIVAVTLEPMNRRRNPLQCQQAGANFANYVERDPSSFIHALAGLPKSSALLFLDFTSRTKVIVGRHASLCATSCADSRPNYHEYLITVRPPAACPRLSTQWPWSANSAPDIGGSLPDCRRSTRSLAWTLRMAGRSDRVPVKRPVSPNPPMPH